MLSLSHSICNSLRRMPDKRHSPFIVRETWLCAPVIESCRGSNGKCYDRWRKGMETNTVSLPSSANHESTQSVCRPWKCYTCNQTTVGAAPHGCLYARGCKHDHDTHIRVKADVRYACVIQCTDLYPFSWWQWDFFLHRVNITWL